MQSHEHRTIKNENSPRTLDCACSSSSADRQEGHDLLRLQTNEIINRKKFVPVPTNEWRIKRLVPLFSMKLCRKI